MAVTLLCPNLKCRSVLQVPQTSRGKKVRCNECGTAFMVPAGGRPATPPPPKPRTEEPAGK